MRIKLNRLDSVIKLPIDFAKLVGIDRLGYYRYEISYQIDVAKAVRNNVSSVQINFKENTPSLHKATIFSAGNAPDVIVDNIRTRFSKQRELKRSNASKTFFSITSDPTKIYKKIGLDNLKITGRYLSRMRSIVMRSGFESSRDGKIRPILTQNAAQTYDRQKSIQHRDDKTLELNINKKREKIIHHNAIFQHGIEPAAYLGSRGHSKISSKHSRTGTVQIKRPRANRRIRRAPLSSSIEHSNKNHRTKMFLKNKHDKSKKIPFSILRNLDSIRHDKDLINSSNPNNSKEIGSNILFPELVTLENEFETIVEYIDLPFGLVPNVEFLLEFNVLNTKSFSVQKISKKVPHDAFVSLYETPKEAPYMKAIPYSNNSKVFLELEQMDENGTGIALYKRIVQADEVITSANFELVENIPLTPEAGKIYYYDTVSTTNPVIYRAITYNFHKDLGGEFSTAVVNNNQKISKLRTYGKKQTYCSMTHKIVNEIIQVEIRNICPGPISLYVERADFSTNNRTYNKIASPVLISDDSEMIILTDTDAKKDRIYHYRCVFIYENGETAIANNDMLVEFTLPEANIVNVLIGQPELSKNPQEIDVKMSIQKDPILKNGDVIKGFLEAQGLSEQYIEEIYNSREKLQSLFFTRVVRQNIITGQEEEFGPLKTNTFSDFELGKIRNVEPLSEGGIYRYVFYTYSRDVDTLFDNLLTSVEQTTSTTFVQTKTNKRFNSTRYDYSPAKWRHPAVLKYGNIVSNKSLIDNHSKSEFTIGKLVDITYIDLDLTENTPTIKNIEVLAIDENNNLLTWEIEGNTNKIDHFIISATNSEIKDVVGKTHNINKNGKFRFVDTLDDNDEGEIIYSITPVYFDMNFGHSESSEAIIIHHGS